MSHDVQVQESWRKAMKLDKWQESFFSMRYDLVTDNLRITHEPTGKELFYSLKGILKIAKDTHAKSMKTINLN